MQPIKHCRNSGTFEVTLFEYTGTVPMSPTNWLQPLGAVEMAYYETAGAYNYLKAHLEHHTSVSSIMRGTLTGI